MLRTNFKLMSLPSPRNCAPRIPASDPKRLLQRSRKFLTTLRIHDLAAEIDSPFHPKGNEFSIHLRSDSGENFATISFANKPGGRELRVNNVTAPLPGAAGSPVQLHIFLDGSVLEIFANGTTSLTARI